MESVEALVQAGHPQVEHVRGLLVADLRRLAGLLVHVRPALGVAGEARVTVS